MKELPPNPPVWTPQGDQWYETHEHRGDSLTDINKTLTAMARIVYDRVGKPFPTAAQRNDVTRAHMLKEQLVRIGEDSIMRIWKINCATLRHGEDPEKAIMDMLSDKELKREY